MVTDDKRGWVQIVEVFIGITLIMGVFLIVLNENKAEETMFSKIHDQEVFILREIEIDSNLREEILDVQDAFLPVEWGFFDSRGLTEIKNKITSRTPDYAECSAKVCAINSVCASSLSTEKNVYANSVGIYANSEKYSPKRLKIFCWEK